MVANLEFHLFGELTLSLPADENDAKRRKILVFSEAIPGQKVRQGAQAGTFMQLTEACWKYLHSNLNESLESPDPFVSSLAVLNAKVGLTRLRRVSGRDLHPLTRAMLDFRLQAELAAHSRATAAA
ncbi:MAG: hypothetical protein WD904_11445 [Dehalococcoidia bacterium]